MLDSPSPLLPVWDVCEQVLDLLMTGLLVAMALHLVAVLVLIFCRCREVARNGRESTVSDPRLPVRRDEVHPPDTYGIPAGGPLAVVATVERSDKVDIATGTTSGHVFGRRPQTRLRSTTQ